MSDRYAVDYLLLAETVTRGQNGETVEGDNGVMTADGEFVSMAGIIGAPAAELLAAHRVSVEGDELDPLELAESLVGALDHVDERRGELVAYAADLPNVGYDEPYVRAVAIRFA